MPDPMEFTLEELRECAEREVKQRKSVYGHRAQRAGEPMSGFHVRQIAMMEAIERLLARLVDEDAASPKQADMFEVAEEAAEG